MASKEGELLIQLPPGIQIEPIDPFEATPVDQDGDADSSTWDTDTYPRSTTDFCLVIVKIKYELDDPTGGVRFILPDNQNTERSPHMYTCCGPLGGLCDGTRTWLPCRDTLRDMCTFRIEITVPEWCIAICGGKLVEQIVSVDEEGSSKRIFRYVLDTPTTASSIGFAVGPFQLHVPPAFPRLTHFCLPEKFSALQESTEKCHAMIAYFEKWFKMKYPFGTYQQVFVEDPPDDCQYLAGGTIIDQALLHNATVVDCAAKNFLVQVEAFVGSWMSASIGLSTTKDAWVLFGIIGHLVNVYVRHFEGKEEYGYRIHRAMEALTMIELLAPNGKAPALLSSEVDVYAEYQPEILHFLRVKSPIVIHMVEQRVGQRHFRAAMQQIVSGIVKEENQPTEEQKAEDEAEKPPATAAPNAALTPGTESLSTFSFLRVVKTIAGSSGQDLTKSFLSYWIIDGGMPFFSGGFWYNRKQTQAEIVLRQTVPAGGKPYTGLITITVVEDTGEFTYQRRIERSNHKWDIPCHSKVRKKRRKRQGLEDPDDSISVTGPGMGLNDTPVYWVGFDVKCAWLRHVAIHQPDFNWMEQLVSDPEIGQRIQAVRALALFHQPHEKPNVMSCRAITECLSGLTHHSKRLRAEAAIALAMWQSIHAPLTCANTALPIWNGLHNLIHVFKAHFFDQTNDMPLPNYFLPSGGRVKLDVSDIQVQEYAAGEYEVKKSIPRACAFIRSKNNQTPPELQAFLLQLLRENDNSKNYVLMKDKTQVVDDGYYIGTILISLSLLVVPDHTEDQEQGVTSMLQYLEQDAVRPSYNQIITACAIEGMCNLHLTGRVPPPSSSFSYQKYLNQKYPLIVRQAAVESIIRLTFHEDPTGRTVREGAIEITQEPERLDPSVVYGPTAGVNFVLDFIQLETTSSKLRCFAVQALVDQSKGYPARVASEALATAPHAYILEMMNEVVKICPTAFIRQFPLREKIKEAFDAISMKHLNASSSNPIANEIVDKLWKCMNDSKVACYDQRLRVALLSLFRMIYGDDTPSWLMNRVEPKAVHWAGGYEALRRMIEESRLGRKQRGRPASPQPKTSSNILDQFKGKRFKLKIGETLVRSTKF